ncbi:MAG: fluoride efflux transporter CrcB [Oceanococcus sp.]
MSYLAVAIGGALGACARYGLSRLLMQVSWPLATLCANVLGSFLIGILFIHIATRLGTQHPAWQLLGIGLLGGFTTFSSFSLETLRLIEQGRVGIAASYVLSSVALCLLAAYLGLILGRRLM